MASDEKALRAGHALRPAQPHAKSDEPICVIGAGAAGLSTAYYLTHEFGFTNVTVLERLGRVGGLVKSIRYRGRTFDLGANYLTAAYRRTRDLAHQVGADCYYAEPPYNSLSLVNGKYVADTIGPFAIRPTGPDDKEAALRFVFQGLQYVAKRWNTQNSEMAYVNWPTLEFVSEKWKDQLTISFHEWLDKSSMLDLQYLFRIPITVMGYNDLKDIPAAYALKYMDERTVFHILWDYFKVQVGEVLKQTPAARPVFDLVYSLLEPDWPKRFTDGFQRLWERVSWKLDVRLGIDIKSVTRDAAKGLWRVNFSQRGQDHHAEAADDRALDFKHLILACPLDIDNLQNNLKVPLDQEQTEHFKKVKTNLYCMATYIQPSLGGAGAHGVKQPINVFVDPVVTILGATPEVRLARKRPGEGDDSDEEHLKVYAVVQQGIHDKPANPFTQYYFMYHPKKSERKEFRASDFARGLRRAAPGPEGRVNWSDRAGRPDAREAGRYQRISAGIHATVSMLSSKLNLEDPLKNAGLSAHSTLDVFPYFQHVDAEVMAQGWYKDLERLQGRDNLYYVGGPTSFELVETILQYSYHFAERFSSRSANQAMSDGLVRFGGE